MSDTNLSMLGALNAYNRCFAVLHTNGSFLHLQTLDDALHLFFAPESLEGYRTVVGKPVLQWHEHQSLLLHFTE
ncbi:hypothetical protein GUJ93_ZPchr0005g15810 [Zizania palustris]|uniref:Uncharacterized protein n=1 Tax=Zizania palustris TaxID=103762 RepID=A0A8J5VIJ7_ZIZPA|nr:hypothetical protein GUJ93_ZPchr0005g15810 [Zizania palustris]